jgi:ElaB/YqjD/DUF883 family membrane-anchored ribosome-binding protein
MNKETQAVYDALAANQGKTLRQASNFDDNRDQLLADLKRVVADADKLIRDAAGATGEGFAALQTRLEDKLAEVTGKLAQARAAVGGKAQYAAAAAQTYVRANPWQSAGVLVAAGVILGFFLGRETATTELDAPMQRRSD